MAEQIGTFTTGARVTFSGFSDEIPENGDLLVEGSVYEIVGVVEGEEEGDETSYLLSVENPDFDSSKRASKKNIKTLDVDVFGDEIVLAEAEEEAAEEDEEYDEETVEAEADEEEEEAPPVAKKKAPAKKAAAKKPTPGKIVEKEDGEISLEKGMIHLQEEEEDEDVLTLVSEAEDICELAHDMLEDRASLDYQIGGILYHVRISEAYKDLHENYAGNKGFALYCEEELGIKYRKAMYLIEIYSTFSRYGIDSSVVEEIGWTKATEVARAVDESNSEELLDLARTSTVVELKDTISEQYVGKGKDTKATKPVEKRVTMKFRVIDEAATWCRDVINRAGEALGYEDESAVFEHIISEWAQDHLDIKQEATKPAAKAKAKPAAKPAAKAAAKPAAKPAAKKPAAKAKAKPAAKKPAAKAAAKKPAARPASRKKAA